MSFSVFCSRDEKDLLDIRVNGKSVYSDVPFCNLRRAEIEIDRDLIRGGSNSVTFAGEGDYALEQIEWQSLLRGERASEFAFVIDTDDYKDARRGIRDVFVVFDFALSNDLKTFDFFINEEEIEVNTFDDSFLITISDFLEDGSNLIKLRPRNSFDIIEMRVELE